MDARTERLWALIQALEEATQSVLALREKHAASGRTYGAREKHACEDALARVLATSVVGIAARDLRGSRVVSLSREHLKTQRSEHKKNKEAYARANQLLVHATNQVLFE